MARARSHAVLCCDVCERLAVALLAVLMAVFLYPEGGLFWDAGRPSATASVQVGDPAVSYCCDVLRDSIDFRRSRYAAFGSTRAVHRLQVNVSFRAHQSRIRQVL